MIFLLQLSITAIALFVTYASVFGLGALFATIAYPIMAAGVALELGKYVAVSYAYQQWTVIGWIERTLLTFFITLMMAFTSAGVFSYLGQSYQSSYSALDLRKAELAAVTVQAETVGRRVAAIESQISNLPSNVVTARIRLMREYEAERAPLVTQLNQLTAKVTELQQSVSTAEVHAGPITYIAKATGTTVEKSATWIILALTMCLDPFALFLTVLMNKLLLLRTSRKDEPAPAQGLVPKPTVHIAEVAPVVETPVVTPLPETFASAVVEEPAPAEVEVASVVDTSPEPSTVVEAVVETPAVLQASTRDKILAATKPAVKRIRKKPEPKTLVNIDLPAATLPKPSKPQINEV